VEKRLRILPQDNNRSHYSSSSSSSSSGLFIRNSFNFSNRANYGILEWQTLRQDAKPFSYGSRTFGGAREL
jgi:hypothetical protein